MGDLRKAILTFTKAQCSAGGASAVDFGMTLFLTELCGIWYAYATFVGAICGGLTNCFINYRWVFHAFDVKKKRIAMRYLFVWSVSILLNTYGTYYLKETFSIGYLLAKVIVAVLVAVLWNYQMQSRYVFHSAHKELPPCNAGVESAQLKEVE